MSEARRPARGIDAWDALCEVVVADRLRTGFSVPIPESDDDWRARSEVWRDPRAVVGGSDAGAHLDTMCGAVYSTSLLGDAVRRRRLLSPWRRRSACSPRCRPGSTAWSTGAGWPRASGPTWCVFDPATRRPRALHTRRDLPGGAARLYAGATGIEHVLVNGVEVVSHGELTGALPGTALALRYRHPDRHGARGRLSPTGRPRVAPPDGTGRGTEATSGRNTVRRSRRFHRVAGSRGAPA